MSTKISEASVVTDLEDADLFALAESTGLGPTGYTSSHVSVATLLAEIGPRIDLTENTTLTTVINNTTTTSIQEGDNLYFTQARIRTEVEEQSGAYTLVLADADHKWKTVTSATAVNLTIPPQADVAWPDNTYIELMQGGAGAVTIVGGTGVTVICNENLTLVTNGLYAVTAIKRLSLNTWVAFGNLVPL